LKEITCSFQKLWLLGVEYFVLIVVILTLFLMEQSSANENTRKEIEIGPFQNEEMMDDIPIIETSIEKLSLEIEASKACKNNDEIFISNLQKLHVQRLF
jgi:hypothetical protein